MIDTLKEIIAIATQSIEHQQFRAGERAKQGGMTLAEAIAKIPVGFYVQCAMEKRSEDEMKESPEGGHQFMTATLFENTPEDGWPNPRHPVDKFLDKCLVSISTTPDDLESFERLTIGMITKRWP